MFALSVFFFRVCNDTVILWTASFDSKKLVSFHLCSAVFSLRFRYQSSKLTLKKNLLSSKRSFLMIIYTYTTVIFSFVMLTLLPGNKLPILPGKFLQSQGCIANSYKMIFKSCLVFRWHYIYLHNIQQVVVLLTNK